MRILVTGTRRGLGNFLQGEYQCEGFTRANSIEEIAGKSYDLIVHCAFNTQNSIMSGHLSSYVEDNIILTHSLATRVKADRFVFISSIDVYPETINNKTEELLININDIKNIYGKTKLMCEDIVLRHKNSLVLRCGGIIGKNKIPKSIRNIIETQKTTLTRDSIVSYINYSTIKDIINHTPNLNGIVNVASDVPMNISEMEKLVPDISYGSYNYKATNVPINRLKLLCPSIKISPSKDVLFDVLGNM